MRSIQNYQLCIQYVDGDGQLQECMSGGFMCTWDYKETTYSKNYPTRMDALRACVTSGSAVLGTTVFGRRSSEIVGFRAILREFWAD